VAERAAARVSDDAAIDHIQPAAGGDQQSELHPLATIPHHPTARTGSSAAGTGGWFHSAGHFVHATGPEPESAHLRAHGNLLRIYPSTTASSSMSVRI